MARMLHKHSTLFGLVTAAIVAALVGYLTHWFGPAIIAAVFGGVWFIPRMFYGCAAARALDNAVTTPGSLGDVGRFGARDMTGLGDNAYQLQLRQAYEQMRDATSGGYDVTGKIADASALAKFAEEEQREQSS